MNAERHFERLEKIEALLASGSGATDGERAAATAARDRARAAAEADGVDWRNPPKKEPRRGWRGSGAGAVDWDEILRQSTERVRQATERMRQENESRRRESFDGRFRCADGWYRTEDEFARWKARQSDAAYEERRSEWRSYKSEERKRRAAQKPPSEAQLDAWARTAVRQWTYGQMRKRVFRAGWRPVSWSDEWRSPTGEVKPLGDAAFVVARARVVKRARSRRCAP